MDLTRLFKKKIKIAELDFNSMSSGNYISKLYSNEYKGILIRNLFSSGDVTQLVGELNQIKEFDSPHLGAKIYPFPCSSQKYNSNFDAFFEDTKSFFTDYYKTFDVDFIKRTTDLIKKISLTDVEIAHIEDNSYLPGTFRMIDENKASIGLTQAHIGIEYVKRCINDGSYEFLKKNVDILKQMSFFTVLQKPIAGGDFTVFDFDYEKYNSITDEFIVNSANKKKKKMYSKGFYKTVSLNIGDAFIFSDFNTWHRVEPIIGTTNRITYGFWFSYDVLKKGIKIWS